MMKRKQSVRRRPMLSRCRRRVLSLSCFALPATFLTTRNSLWRRSNLGCEDYRRLCGKPESGERTGELFQRSIAGLLIPLGWRSRLEAAQLNQLLFQGGGRRGRFLLASQDGM